MKCVHTFEKHVSTEKSTVPFDFRVECSEKERRNTDSFQTKLKLPLKRMKHPKLA